MASKDSTSTIKLRAIKERIRLLACLSVLTSQAACAIQPTPVPATKLQVKISVQLPVESASCMGGTLSTPGAFLLADNDTANDSLIVSPTFLHGSRHSRSSAHPVPKAKPFGVSMKIPPGIPNGTLPLPGSPGSVTTTGVAPTLDQIIAQQTSYTNARLIIAASAAIFLNGMPEDHESHDRICPFYITIGLTIAQSAGSADPTQSLIPARCLQNPQQECDINLPVVPWKAVMDAQKQRLDVITAITALTDASGVLTASEREYQTGL